MAQPISFDRVADRYDATRAYSPDVASQIAAGIARVGALAPGAPVLEIGVGTGRIALPLLERGLHLTGVDVAARMLDQMRAKYAALQAAVGAPPVAMLGRLAVRQADITALPFADASFAAVVAVHVFHLIADWRRAFDEALRVLRPEGALLLGQDAHAGRQVDVVEVIQRQWREICARLGFTPASYPGAGYRDVLNAARAERLVVAEHTLAAWTGSRSPAEVLRELELRTWSRTWEIPDDVFAESIAELRGWVAARYGARVSAPLPERLSFVLARVARPSGR